jgi:hypothetical protein
VLAAVALVAGWRLTGTPAGRQVAAARTSARPYPSASDGSLACFWLGDSGSAALGDPADAAAQRRLAEYLLRTDDPGLREIGRTLIASADQHDPAWPRRRRTLCAAAAASPPRSARPPPPLVEHRRSVMRWIAHRTGLAAAVTLLGLVSGCTGSADGTTGAPATTGPAQGGALTDATLASALLQLSDAPDGYTQTTPRPNEHPQSDQPQCLTAISSLEIDRPAQPGAAFAQIAFTSPDHTTALQEILRGYPSGGASGALSVPAAVLANCPRFTLTYPDGTSLTESVQVVSSDAVHLSLRVTAQGSGVVVRDNMRAQLVNDILVVVSYAGPAAPDSNQTQAMMTTALHRLRAVTGG